MRIWRAELDAFDPQSHDAVAPIIAFCYTAKSVAIVHVISRRALVDFWTLHPPAAKPMAAWFKVVSGAAFTKFADVRRSFNSADRVAELVVFDVGAGYRIVTVIHFDRGRIYVREVLTHAEYDRWSAARRGKR